LDRSGLPLTRTPASSDTQHRGACVGRRPKPGPRSRPSTGPRARGSKDRGGGSRISFTAGRPVRGTGRRRCWQSMGTDSAAAQSLAVRACTCPPAGRGSTTDTATVGARPRASLRARSWPPKPRYPLDCHPKVDVRSAVGRFEDFATVVGTQRRDERGCWCMTYRDSRTSGVG
jgi:hypothetical protein